MRTISIDTQGDQVSPSEPYRGYRQGSCSGTDEQAKPSSFIFNSLTQGCSACNLAFVDDPVYKARSYVEGKLPFSHQDLVDM